MSAILLVAAKDLRLELASGGTLAAILVFSLAVLASLSYVLPPEPAGLAASVYWTSLVFGALTGFGNLFLQETADDAASALATSPVHPAAIYLGKFLAAAMLLFLLQVVMVPAFLVLYNLPLAGWLGPFAVVLVLGTLALAAIGTLLAAMTGHLASRGFLIPVLALPLLVPILVAASAATRRALAGDSLASEALGGPVLAMAGFDLLMTGASALLYRVVLAKE